MDVKPTEMTPLQRQQNEASVKNFNRSLNRGKGLQQNLGKDSFLKILTEQLKNQDPLKPQDDTQFIAQMAQFNSLEQMIQLNDSFNQLSKQYVQVQALGLLGQKVTVHSGLDRDGQPMLVRGIVTGIDQTGSGAASITVNGENFSVDQVQHISQAD